MASWQECQNFCGSYCFLWWHYAAVGWATGVVWSSKGRLKHKASVSLMPEGCRDQAAKIAVGAATGPIWGQTTSGNRRTLFLTAKNQEIKSSPLHESNKSVRTHGLRHHSCRLLLDQTSYPIQQGHLAPGLVRGQGQASGNYWKRINLEAKKPTQSTNNNTTNQPKTKTRAQMPLGKQ